MRDVSSGRDRIVTSLPDWRKPHPYEQHEYADQDRHAAADHASSWGLGSACSQEVEVCAFMRLIDRSQIQPTIAPLGRAPRQH